MVRLFKVCTKYIRYNKKSSAFMTTLRDNYWKNVSGVVYS